ncbi:MAG: hypothetical protein AAFV53_13575 [Myxococcota bacterium]
MSAILTVMQTCRLLEPDPHDHLVWVLPKLVVHPDNHGRKIADLDPAAYHRIKANLEGFD